MSSDQPPESKGAFVDSLTERVEPFVPLAMDPLPPVITGALAELGIWWQERVSIDLSMTTIDTTHGDNFESGCKTANTAIDSGANLLILTSSHNYCSPEVRAIIGLLCRKDAFSIYFQDQGTTDQFAMRSIAEIRDLMHRHMAIRGEPLLLAELDPTVDFAAGILLTASARRTPVITGNSTHLAAALIVQRLTMKASNWWRHGSTSLDPAITSSVDRLGIPAGLDLNLTDHTGIGAQISAQLLQSFIED